MQKNKQTSLSRGPTRQSPLARNHTRKGQLCTNQGQDQDQDLPKLSSSSHTSCAPNLPALPVELLVSIFTFCTQALDNPSLPYPAWLYITHVCRCWRTVALSHGPLWTSITQGLSLRWIKAFMERSGTMQMDFDIHISSGYTVPGCASTYHHHKDIVPLLTNFTRVRSLSFTGYYDWHSVRPIIDSLRSLLHVQSLTLCIKNGMKPHYILPGDLFGGKAPIRRLQWLSDMHIVAPYWLLHGVTHFTSGESLTVPQLVDALRNMPALAYFEFQGGLRVCTLDDLGTPPIQMPQLMDLTVRAPKEFILLNRLLLLPVGAKRHMAMSVGAFGSGFFDGFCVDDLLATVEVANGFQHIHFSQAEMGGWFRLWTGNAVTTWEDAAFNLHVYWGTGGLSRANLRYFTMLCDVLGTASVRRLVIDSPSSGLPKSYWSMLLHKLPGVEEVELYPSSVDTWKDIGAPAMLPALQTVRIVNSGLGPNTQYLWTRRRAG